MIEHLVALIENEALDAAKTKLLVADEGIETTWRGDNDVRVGLLVGQELDVLLHWCTSVKDSSLDIWHVLAESGVLVLNLISQFTGVAHDEYGSFAVDWFHLLESCEDEDSSLSETRFGLTEDVGAEDCLWNAYLLDC